MARYIDADKLKERLEDFSRWCMDRRKEGVDFVLDCSLPAMVDEDVVPKSEVEKLQEVIFKKEDLMQKIVEERNKYSDEVEWLTEDVERLQELNSRNVEDILLAKTEGAREIFEEIEKILNRKVARSKPQLEKLHSNKKDLSIWGYKDLGYFQGIISTCEDFQNTIDELKKKYTAEIPIVRDLAEEAVDRDITNKQNEE